MNAKVPTMFTQKHMSLGMITQEFRHRFKQEATTGMLKFCIRFVLNNVYKSVFGIFFILFRS